MSTGATGGLLMLVSFMAFIGYVIFDRSIAALVIAVILAFIGNGLLLWANHGRLP